MQFDNKVKITDLQKGNVELIKDYLDAYVCTSRYAKSVCCETSLDNGSYIADFILECDGFFTVLQYDSFETLSASFDIKLVYYGCDYRFSVYDIFNLFDIQDFRKYYYTECIDGDTIKNILGELTALIEKYGIDFKRAGSGSDLKRLRSNYEADHILKNGNEWKYYVNDYETDDNAHISWLITTASTTDKLIEKLEKHSDYLCLYEKRLLEYLKSGNTVDESDFVSQKREFNRAKRKVNIPLLIISAVIIAIVQLVLNKTIFSGAFIPAVKNVEIIGIELPVSFGWVALACSAVALYAFLSYTVGRFIIKRIVPACASGYAKAKYCVNDNVTVKSKIMSLVILPAAMLVLSAVFAIAGNVGFAFYDDYAKDYYVPSDYHHISYEDIEFYSIAKNSNDEDYNGICYAVSYGDDYAVFAPCKQGSGTDEKIKEIAANHGKSITYLEAQDELERIISESIE